MRVFDAHCDMLLKIWRNPSINIEYDESLQVSISRLKSRLKPIQCFAIFVPEEIPFHQRHQVAEAQIAIFYNRILDKYPEIKLIKSKADIDKLANHEIGAILTLEGCDAIGDSLEQLEIFYQLGIRSVGLTWNFANLVADGAYEKRNGGLTNFGEKVIKYLNHKSLWTDLSHACEASFWEALEIANHPIASHSNVFNLCPHVRNLKDDQIIGLFRKNGMIGLTFVPFFTAKSKATISDLLNHIDYLCSLGGESHIGFGSDFDGIDETIIGLENYSCYDQMINLLHKNYSQRLVDRILFQNFYDHISF